MVLPPHPLESHSKEEPSPLLDVVVFVCWRSPFDGDSVGLEEGGSMFFGVG